MNDCVLLLCEIWFLWWCVCGIADRRPSVWSLKTHGWKQSARISLLLKWVLIFTRVFKDSLPEQGTCEGSRWRCGRQSQRVEKLKLWLRLETWDENTSAGRTWHKIDPRFDWSDLPTRERSCGCAVCCVQCVHFHSFSYYLFNTLAPFAWNHKPNQRSGLFRVWVLTDWLLSHYPSSSSWRTGKIWTRFWRASRANFEARSPRWI